jgi:hypothetical protein
MKIIVNGTEHDYQDEKIGYEEVAKLARGGNSRELTVTYFWRHAVHHDLARSGTLPSGIWKKTRDGHLRKTIKVAEGMRFTAVSTGAA